MLTHRWRRWDVMAMRLADTFLVHPRSCFAILFSGQTLLGVCPFFQDNAASLHRPMRVRSSSRFLTRMRFGLRSVGARAVRTIDGICASANKNARSGSQHLTKLKTRPPALSYALRGVRRFLLTCIPNRPADSGTTENSNAGPTRAAQCCQAALSARKLLIGYYLFRQPEM